MKKKKKSRSRCTMGRVLISIGVLVRILQITGAYLRLPVASNALLSACMLCFFIGGLGVFAYEHQGAATFLSLLCALCSLLGSFLVSLTDSGAFAGFLSTAFYFLTFGTFGAMIFSLGKPVQKGAGALVILLGALLILPLAGVSMSEGVLLTLLIGTWTWMGISIYL